MNRPLHIITQEAIIREHDISPLIAARGWRHSTVPANGYLTALHALERDVAEKDERPVLFTSLMVAGFVERHHPVLSRGLIRASAFLRHSHYHAYLPRGMALNEDGIYLPWGQIQQQAARLKALFPQGLFIRPDSPLKPFTGFAVGHDRLAEEWMLQTKTCHIPMQEMCFVAPCLDLDSTEYRVWIVNARPVTSSAYGWDVEKIWRGDVPPPIIHAATDLGRELKLTEQVYTADFIMHGERPRLVELNAVSTSGWYPDMKPSALMEALDQVFL